MSSAPAVIPFYGEGAGRLFPIYCDVTHACRNRPTHDPHVTHDPPRRAFNAGHGEAQASEKVTAVKIRPAYPRTVVGLAQQCVALMCGLGPGLLSVYKSRGTPLFTPLLVHEKSERRPRPH